MDSLDLRHAPPRPPSAELAGLVFLPRTIDKVRATLAGGHLGHYNVEGFSAMMLTKIGIELAAFEQSVRDAATEAEVAAFVTAHANPDGIADWNEFVRNRKIFNGNREEAIEEFPWLRDHPEVTHSLEFLALDDRRSFPQE